LRVLLITLVLQLFPLVVGMMVRMKRAELALRLAAKLRRMGSILLAIVVIMLLVTRGAFLVTMGATTLVSMLGLVVLSLAAGRSPRGRAFRTRCSRASGT
jgi:BASS family bile acid:Na+ symporter